MVNFPSSFDNDASLFVAVNNLRTQLTSGIDGSTLTVPVTTTSGYPAVGFISILTGTDITQTEAIKYTSVGATQFNASQRGADGTTASPHSAGNNVDFTIVASHHNELKDATVELEYFVGVSGSENFLRIDEFVSASGSLQTDIDNRVEKPFVETINVGVEFPGSGTGDGTQTAAFRLHYGGTINEAVVDTSSGTLTYTVLINDVEVEGLDNQPASGTANTDTATSANTFTTEQKIKVAISGAAAAQDFLCALEVTRA